MPAIQTQYNGRLFNSRLDARWAVFFDALCVKYEYGENGFDFKFWENYKYFWIPEFDCYFMTRPWDIREVKFLAEKFTKRVVMSLGDSVDDFARLIAVNIPDFYYEVKIDSTSELVNAAFLHGYQDLMSGCLTVHCPVCGGEYVGFGVPSHAETDNYNVWKGRGDAVKIPMHCETDLHLWVLVLGFHKGNTFLTFEDVTEFSTNNYALMFANGDRDALRRAYGHARYTRFEHGETPKV